MFEEFEDLAADGSLEAPLRVSGSLAFGHAAGDVGFGRGIQPHPDQGDGVHCSMQLAVAAAVDPVLGYWLGSRGVAGVSPVPG
ncbi:hypothetical protein G3I40_19765 [Streptomyces sp. SID14478]|uniref:hypothetical protein n=1 Tax=Streptomyces sp. SID14478 TaxID=2706073 RepID=UPI0013DA18F3|nr:hypothetical protein [Streptomyces sp. SID14478]NEB77437.1 hypothetical protein [Streptomyces sp. SID14478]